MIVGSGTVAFTVPRDAPPTRPPGAPRGGGLYVGSGGEVSSCAAAGASFCASADDGTTMTGRWELAQDPENWKADFDVSYTPVT